MFDDEDEKLEKARQAVMRLRELLDLMREQLEEGEQAYTRLFDQCTPEEIATLKQKDLQKRAALNLIDDPSLLSQAAMQLRFAARNLEHDFEQLYNNITPT